ncbi:hypothetical protein DTW90_36735 [Neorhizobium sp. P12A]|nr:hypothetical protein DTW90_36735 [Neorhizobium sp. P12A]
MPNPSSRRCISHSNCRCDRALLTRGGRGGAVALSFGQALEQLLEAAIGIHNLMLRKILYSAPDGRIERKSGDWT